MFRALMTDHDLLPELLRVDGLVTEARVRAETYVAGTTRLAVVGEAGRHGS
jgi:hypothetical protein